MPWVSEPDSDDKVALPRAAEPPEDAEPTAWLTAAASDWSGAVEDATERAAAGLTVK
jgi:hypothetical protein